MKTILSIALAAICASAMAQSEPPADVPKDHWAYPAVQNLYRLGILKGYPDGTFKGSRPVSRFEVASAVNALFMDRKAVLDGIQTHLDVYRPQRVPIEDLAAIRRDLDALRADVGELKKDKAEVESLTRDFAGLNDQLRRIRADLDDMRGRLPKVKN